MTVFSLVLCLAEFSLGYILKTPVFPVNKSKLDYLFLPTRTPK